jgi:hypothetical protein
LLNNSCEVFNKYILDAREMPILSIIMKIKDQLMGRVYNKQKDVHEKWLDPICPKIRKKIMKNSEWVNTCYVSLAGRGAFEVKDIDYHFTVNINDKQKVELDWHSL